VGSGSREANVEVVRRSFDHFETADMDAWTADWHPDIVFDVSGYAPWTDLVKVYRGHVEILEFFGRMMAGVRVLTVHMHEISAVDEDRVIALYTERRQESGGEPYPLEVGIVYTLRDGRFARVQVHSDFAAARRTAATVPGTSPG
jgi:ketosteroid isomerase-like protein